MPAIIIKDFNWRQSIDTIIIDINLQGYPKNMDLFVVDNYMKASYPPFLLELFLWSEILDDQSRCVVDGKKAIISLKKKEEVLWPNLEVENLTKAIKREKRNRAIENAQKISEEKLKNKMEKRHNLHEKAVRAQINLDTETINKIDELRNNHRKQAMQELEEWRLRAEIPMLRNCSGDLQENRKAYRGPLKWFVDEDKQLKSRELTDEEVLSAQETGKQSSQVKKLEWRELMDETNEQSAAIEKVAWEQRKQDRTNQEEQTITELKTAEKIEFSSSSSSSSFPSSGNEKFSNKDERSVSSAVVTDEESIKLSKMFNRQTTIETKVKKSNDSSISACSSSEDSEDEKNDEDKRRRLLIDRIVNERRGKFNKIFDEPLRNIPLPRSNGKIEVSFTERAFPTPARESSQLEEQEWLEKQAAARRQTGFYAKDLKPEEQDPQWLKDKGDEFLKAGNNLAAISAYTHGIKLSQKMAVLYVNRSAAQYALENYHRCIEDCSTALELMTPKCEANREARAKCYARRGAAFCKLSAPQHGIPEFEEALKLAPNDEEIKRDLFHAKQYFEIKDK